MEAGVGSLSRRSHSIAIPHCRERLPSPSRGTGVDPSEPLESPRQSAIVLSGSSGFLWSQHQGVLRLWRRSLFVLRSHRRQRLPTPVSPLCITHHFLQARRADRTEAQAAGLGHGQCDFKAPQERCKAWRRSPRQITAPFQGFAVSSESLPRPLAWANVSPPLRG